MNNNTLFYTATEVKEMLGISRSVAYKLIAKMNAELASRGFITIAGKIPKKYFHEHYYGMSN